MDGAAAASNQLFTRGVPNAADTRGESMVQKHLARLQAEKEKAALEQLSQAFPKLAAAPALLAAALEDVAWEPPPAIDLLLAFQAERATELEVIKQSAGVRSASLTGKKRERDTADSKADGSGSEGSDSDAGPRHKRSKDKHKKSSKKKKDKYRRKDKKPKLKGSSAKAKEELTATEVFGKYGIIRECDMYSKRSEFSMWATEVQKVDIETLPKFEEKELFRTYMEDFNTGTLPHKKYYNLDLYEQHRAKKAAKKGRPLDAEKSVFNDEEEVRRATAAARAAAQEERLRDAYNELKYTAPGKAQEMRDQELMRMHMNLAYRTGDHEKASRIQEKLKPDAEKDPRLLLNPPP